MHFNLAYEQRKGVTRTQCLVVWDPDTAPFTFAQGRSIEWLGRVVDRHFHHSTVIGRNSDGKGRSCSNCRFVHFSAYAFQCTVGLSERWGNRTEGRCTLGRPTNLQMHYAARDACCIHLNTFVYSASSFERSTLNRETRVEMAEDGFDFHFQPFRAIGLYGG